MSTSNTTTDDGVSITWQWWSSQSQTLELLREAEHDLVVFRGGYGSGKTILGTRWIIETALSMAKSDNLIIAPDSTKGGPTTYKTFFEQLPGENTVPDEGGDPENSPVIADYHAVEKRATFANGSVVRLGSADVWNRYAGGEFHSIYCDEVAHYETTDLYDLHEMLTSRQRTEEGPNITLWTSTGNGFDQFYDITERQVTKDDEPLAWSDAMAIVTADSRDNPFLNEKDKLRRQFEGTTREEQALKGGFSAAQGLVYSRFNRHDHVRDTSDVPLRGDRRIYGYDYGWQDPRVLLELAKTPQGQYVAVDCYYETNQPVEHCIQWLREHRKPGGRVYCDHDPEHIDKFRQAGYPAKAATKDLDEGISEVREVLQVDDVGPGLIVTESCTELIQEMQSYKEEDVGTSRAEDHVLDSLRYAIMGDRYVDETKPGPTW